MLSILHLLPLALALALSSVPIMAALFILLSPNRSRSAVPFLTGWVAGMLVVVTLCTLGAQFVPASRLPRRPDEVVGQLEIAVGIALILVGIWSFWRARRREVKTVPAWLRSTETLGPFASFGLAFILNFRPKAILLAVAAGLSLRADTDTIAEAAVAIALYTIVGASTVAIPIIATQRDPDRMVPQLVTAREWIGRNGDAITAVIIAVVGLVVIGMGLERL